MAAGNQVHLDLDQAWDPDVLGMERRDVRDWGPRLRCFAQKKTMESFIREVSNDLPPFVLYGSGDFHHLTATFLRKVRSQALTLVSFDNHPDWDVRPPHWACGGWMKRALELPSKGTDEGQSSSAGAAHHSFGCDNLPPESSSGGIA